MIGVIPARYGSTRLEGKVLKDICGKPMVQHIWEAAKKAVLLDDVIVATDDERVMKAVASFGGKAVMTAKEHASGTDRIVEAVFSVDCDIVINIQGDEPLVEPAMLDLLADAMLSDEKLQMATLIKKIENASELDNHNVVKIVLDRNNFAIYFSRSRIPFLRFEPASYYKHIGIYAYTKDFLLTFAALKPSPLEKAEGLEQLRAIENGYKIKAVETNVDTIAVDVAEDLKLVELKLRA